MPGILARRFARFSLLVLVSFVVSCRAGGGQNRADVTSPRPAWTVDLRTQGYSTPFVNSAPKALRQITFGSNNEIAVLNDSGICGKENPAVAFVVDSKSGTLLTQTKLVSSCWPYIFGNSKDGYTVSRSGGMVVYSPRFGRVIATADGLGAERASSDGKVLGAWRQAPGQAITYLVDASTLRPTGIEVSNRNVVAVAANSVAYIVTRLGSPMQIIIVDDGKSPPKEFATGCGLVQVRFVSSDTLAVLGCNRLKVIDISGAELFSVGDVGYAGNGWISAVSRNEKRFVVTHTLETPGGGDAPARIRAEQITVFDISLKSSVLTVELEQLRGLDAPAHASGVALSPDGKLLAVNSEGLLRLFSLQ